MARISGRQILKIAILPGIIPRTRELMSGGFGYIAFYIAHIFWSVRLLPPGHPYLSTANMGRFGISHVTSEAWRSVVRGQRHLDQIVIFMVIMLGIAILFVQFCFLGMAIFSQAAHALPPLPAGGFLGTANPDNDVAFVMLDYVFGIPPDGATHFFGSCVAQQIDCFTDNPLPVPSGDFPYPYHYGLHAMLQIYSVGLLVIAMVIFSYFAVTIILETAESGTPFGRRFNALWAPVRMVLALALLIPIANGLNAAQYIVLYAAKWGSGLATNGWNIFVTDALNMGHSIMGDPVELVANPSTPPVNSFVQFATVLAACKFAEASGVNPRDVEAYVVFPKATGPASRAPLIGLTYANALLRSNYDDIYYVFGVYDQDSSGNPLYSSYPGQVKPVCGELVLKITDVDDAFSPGSQYMLEQYHRLVTIMWMDIMGLGAWGSTMPIRTMGYGFVRRNFPDDIRWTASGSPDRQDEAYPLATSQDLEEARQYYEDEIELAIANAIALQVASPVWTTMSDYGWGGAGIWYNNVARLNGTIVSAVYSMPSVRKYPEIMEYVSRQRQAAKESGNGAEKYNPELATGKSINFTDPKGYISAYSLYQAMNLWEGAHSSVPVGGSNVFLDTINMIFGTGALFQMSDNTNIHPLAALVALGRSLLEASLRNLGGAAIAGLAGGFANIFREFEPLGKTLSVASSFALQVGMLGLSMGFLLFYVLPFIPFLYFFFAVGGWVKGIFESMVAVPLWALAHIRIDGQSMPGDAARGGYFMIFEIFLRPLLIVFGLLAAITIYAAQVKVLNEIWPLVTSNLAGFDSIASKLLPQDEVGGIDYYRGLADRFFFTVMYAVVVYMLGMSSFKLIDTIPGKIMRWLGTDASGFTDQANSGPDGLMTRMSVGTNMMTQDASSALSSMGAAGSGLAKAARSSDRGGG